MDFFELEKRQPKWFYYDNDFKQGCVFKLF